MRMFRRSKAGVSQGLCAEPSLLVRKVRFWDVYYNNGNSLPVFSIPSSWGNFGPFWRSGTPSISDHSSKAANRITGSLFSGNDVCAPHLLKAGLHFSIQAKSGQGRGLFALQEQDVKSRGKTVTRSSDTLKS